VTISIAAEDFRRARFPHVVGGVLRRDAARYGTGDEPMHPVSGSRSRGLPRRTDRRPGRRVARSCGVQAADLAEVKRMYVRADARRPGSASRS